MVAGGNMNRHRVGALVGVGVCALVLGGCIKWQSALVSVDVSGTGAGNGASSGAVISPDGSKVAFVSAASNLVAGDGNGAQDVFVRDLAAGTTSLVSVNATGTGSGNGASSQPSFSADGTKVLFTSLASDLGPTDTNGTGARNVYIRDLAAGTTQLVSHNHDLYMRDLTTDAITLVTVNAAGTDAVPLGFVTSFAFSPDGTQIAFGNLSNGFEPLDTGGFADICLRDLVTATTTLVSDNAAGTDGGNNVSRQPVFSPDGTRIAFTSAASNLGPVDTNGCVNGGFVVGCDDVYLRDLSRGTTDLISVNAAGDDSGNGFAGSPAFSPDGGKIVFTSTASDLGPIDTNTCPVPVITNIECQDIYLRDLAAGTTTLVSVNASEDDAATGPSRTPLFSPNGYRVVFTSRAADLGPKDTNGVDDVYVRDLGLGVTDLLSANADNSDSGNAASGPDYVVGPDSSTVAYTSLATNLGATDDQQTCPTSTSPPPATRSHRT